ncbi:MAG: type II toxin-antitoxin system PemK/MazF family toxin [Anaerolineae bacterium]
MTTTEQGDVVLVNYPTTDLRATKKRPAVVISSSAYNRESLDCVVVPVTSRINRAPSPYEVLVDGYDQAEAGLYKPSLVKAGVLFTIEQGMIQRSIGSTPKLLLEKILTAVGDVLAIG